jgi:hypothetical protein
MKLAIVECTCGSELAHVYISNLETGERSVPFFSKLTAGMFVAVLAASGMITAENEQEAVKYLDTVKMPFINHMMDALSTLAYNKRDQIQAAVNRLNDVNAPYDDGVLTAAALKAILRSLQEGCKSVSVKDLVASKNF